MPNQKNYKPAVPSKAVVSSPDGSKPSKQPYGVSDGGIPMKEKFDADSFRAEAKPHVTDPGAGQAASQEDVLEISGAQGQQAPKRGGPAKFGPGNSAARKGNAMGFVNPKSSEPTEKVQDIGKGSAHSAAGKSKPFNSESL